MPAQGRPAAGHLSLNPKSSRVCANAQTRIRLIILPPLPFYLLDCTDYQCISRLCISDQLGYLSRLGSAMNRCEVSPHRIRPGTLQYPPPYLSETHHTPITLYSYACYWGSLLSTPPPAIHGPPDRDPCRSHGKDESQLSA